ncbi:MAG: phosphoenolpyruvate synthase, partial [Chrysiogenetes bacterium]|nr:phosphoenolpyruvate synthase [Chrysiogenetes bacterium]
MAKHVEWFADLTIEDVPQVGGKNASLGEMYRSLSDKGVKVPNGFATTADSYRYFMKETGLDKRIREILAGLDTHDIENLRARGRALRQAIVGEEFPADLKEAIVAAYRKLSEGVEGGVDVAVRSSATAEDLPDASFAGQQETYLNVHSEAALLDACRRCYASLFTDRAISYRTDKDFDHFQVALSVGVQRMVRSDLASSGVMFSIDTETGFRDAVLINGAWGLGENVVQGAVNPDEFYVFKPTLKQGKRPILQKKVGSKEFKMVYDTGGAKMVKNVPVTPADRARFCVNEEEILTLARWACIIEDHYTERRGQPTPMDMEWAKDGKTGELFIVQARPETVVSQRNARVLERYELKETGRVLATGSAVGERIGAGPVCVIESVEQMGNFKPGAVLVTDKTDPDWEPVMKQAAAIVTNRGGRTCHAAIVSRELGLPAIVGSEDATTRLSTGQQVTVSCAGGDEGRVYEGALKFVVEKIDLEGLEEPRTKVMMNLANPAEAFSLSFLPSAGVGLAREEFIINTYIKIHPVALLRYDQLEDAGARAKIDELTAGYDDKPQFFVDKLAEGIAMIGADLY